MSSKSLLLIFSLLISFLSSCSVINQGSGYDANPVFTPLHEKSGQLKISAGYGGILGTSGNASYSFNKHFAIMTGGVYNHQHKKTIEAGFFSSKFFRLRNHYLEGAVGYFTPIRSGSFSNLEVFVGLGKGTTNKTDSFNKDFSGYYTEVRGNYFKTFLQASLKVAGTNPKIDLVLANRISHVYFQNLAFYDMYSNEPNPSNFDKANTLFTEPVIIINYGKQLKGIGQIGLALPLSGGRLENINSSNTNVSSIFQLGMVYEIK